MFLVLELNLERFSLHYTKYRFKQSNPQLVKTWSCPLWTALARLPPGYSGAWDCIRKARPWKRLQLTTGTAAGPSLQTFLQDQCLLQRPTSSLKHNYPGNSESFSTKFLLLNVQRTTNPFCSSHHFPDNNAINSLNNSN